MFHFPQSHIQIILVHSECFFLLSFFSPHHRIQYCNQLLFQGVLCPGPAQVPELWVSCASSSTTNLNPSLNHWCLRMRKRRRKMMSQSWSCCHWGVRAGSESLQCWVSPLHREQQGNQSEYTVMYFIKDKQQLGNCLLPNIKHKVCVGGKTVNFTFRFSRFLDRIELPADILKPSLQLPPLLQSQLLFRLSNVALSCCAWKDNRSCYCVRIHMIMQPPVPLVSRFS